MNRKQTTFTLLKTLYNISGEKSIVFYPIAQSSEKYSPANIPAIPAITAAVIRQSAMCPPVYLRSGVFSLLSSVTTTVGELVTPIGITVADTPLFGITLG